MRDAFPHPYSMADATAFLGAAAAMQPRTWFAVTVDDEAVGGIGYTLHGDVERVAAEIGWMRLNYFRNTVGVLAFLVLLSAVLVPLVP
jgi:RimJ/RimL family protein N-acetyltransferase